MSSTSVVQSNPVTEKGVFLSDSTREVGRGSTARRKTVSAPRTPEQWMHDLYWEPAPRRYTREEIDLLHECSMNFLTAPCRGIVRLRQMPNDITSDVRTGRMSLEGLIVTLGNAQLQYADLNDFSKKKPLRKLGLWGMAAGKRGPKGKR